ncbi:hypothetical protein N7495_006330 [Penicillium taxi]|uniref:uncharacterized protein n=1 Tax=Penicillium taxi TaxID=168475 RepID=UPI002545028F|nr:uncharacterized protein N7495_006330 [Penicillium taxi]KAJ5894639.1 hypothetical protein N7495_006330 [Penicillium taxi]
MSSSVKSRTAASLRSSTPSAQSGDFSEKVQIEARQACGDRCWVCGSPDPQIAHIFGKKDKKVRFFLDFEARDKEQRKAWGRQRIVPTSTEYSAHCRSKFTQYYNDDETNIHGLYQRICVKHFIAPDFLPQIVLEPRQWPGAPVATLRHAFMSTASAFEFWSSDERTYNQLKSLQRAYFWKVEVSGSDQASPSKSQDDQGGPSKSQKGEQKRKRDSSSYPTHGQCQRDDIFLFGPNMSTQDAVFRWPHLCHRSLTSFLPFF